MTTTTQSNEKDVPAVPLPISLRDWFAGQIIAGALANPGLLERVAGRTLEQMMREVYEGADALLSARGEPK